MSFEIDSDVKPLRLAKGSVERSRYHATRRGEFVKAGCSVAPSAIPKIRNERRGNSVHRPHATR